MKTENKSFLDAIARELSKRVTAYPRIITKMQKNVASYSELNEQFEKMENQIANLNAIYVLILSGQGKPPSIDPFIDEKNTEYLNRYLDELMRELKMRKRLYKRWVYFKRMDQDTADMEIDTWERLTRWFAKTFLELDELPKRKRKS